MEKFNEICTSLPKVQKLTDARKTAIRRRWEDDAKKDISWFVRLFGKVRESDFLSGRNGRSWRADFDWIIKAGNCQKIQEGVYDNRGEAQQQPAQPAKPTPNGNYSEEITEDEANEIRQLLARTRQLAEEERERTARRCSG